MPARILVVDDEQRVRRLIREVLATAGHEALEAATHDEGLALIEGHGEAIELAILDINLPDGSGFGLFESLRALRPGLCGLPRLARRLGLRWTHGRDTHRSSPDLRTRRGYERQIP